MDDITEADRATARLSWRAKEILTLLADHGIGSDVWPLSNGNWSATLGRRLYLSGSGDARIIRSLVNKGLASWSKIQCGEKSYVTAITEDGMLLFERTVRAQVEVPK